MDNPCSPDCENRNSVCHITCPDYKKFRDEKDKEIHKRSEINRTTPDISAEIKRIIRRNLNRKK